MKSKRRNFPVFENTGKQWKRLEVSLNSLVIKLYIFRNYYCRFYTIILILKVIKNLIHTYIIIGMRLNNI